MATLNWIDNMYNPSYLISTMTWCSRNATLSFNSLDKRYRANASFSIHSMVHYINWVNGWALKLEMLIAKSMASWPLRMAEIILLWNLYNLNYGTNNILSLYGHSHLHKVQGVIGIFPLSLCQLTINMLWVEVEDTFVRVKI